MYTSDHSKIEFNKKDGILKVSLKNSISDDDCLKTELLHMASAAKQNGVKKILIHNKDLAHPISNDLQNWAHLSVELPLLQAGVDKIAIIKPAGSRSFALTNHHDNERKKYFPTEDSAMKWLNGK